MTEIRALIVDDEVLARRGIRNQLKHAPDVAVIGEASNGREALTAIREKKPDLVFLDVQMPLLDGFGVIERLDKHLPAAIVFVTAFDEHAIRAFEVNALDYLLKPVDPRRFQKTLDRVRAQLNNSQPQRRDEKLLALLENLKSANNRRQEYLQRLPLKETGRVSFVDVNDIDWIEAQGNYVELHTGNGHHFLRETMSRIESKLDPARFVRLRRSIIARIDQIKSLQPLAKGEFEVLLKSGHKFKSSRRYRRRLDVLLRR
jgi:two-component system, LytTR family, response regulator